MHAFADQQLLNTHSSRLNSVHAQGLINMQTLRGIQHGRLLPRHARPMAVPRRMTRTVAVNAHKQKVQVAVVSKVDFVVMNIKRLTWQPGPTPHAYQRAPITISKPAAC